MRRCRYSEGVGRVGGSLRKTKGGQYRVKAEFATTNIAAALALSRIIRAFRDKEAKPRKTKGGK